MTSSKKPNMSRKTAYNRPMHVQAKAVAAHLDKKLAAELKTRSITVRKGDTVKIFRGEFASKEGKVTSVDRAKGKVYIEKIVKKNSKGAEREIAIDASKVLIIDLDRTDRKRLGGEVKAKK